MYRFWIVILSTSIFRRIFIGFRHLFWSLFNIMFITFCMPFSNIDFAFIFDVLFSIVGCPEPRFLLENKQFGAFQPFSQKYNKSMILVSVLASFWKAFGIHLVSCFGIIFCIDFGMAFSGFLDPFERPQAISSHFWTRKARHGRSKSIQRAHLFGTLGPPLVQRPQKHGPLH